VHVAVLDGNVEALRLLMAHGADLNKRDSDSWTPLHTACACGDVEITK
jgi:ankyrin repeat protein